MDSDDFLFSTAELASALENNKARMRQEILETPEDYLLNVDLEEWISHLVAKHSITPLMLRRNEMAAEDLGETRVDVRYDRANRAISDTSQPVYMPGRSVKVTVPFDGDPDLFELRPNSFTSNPPRAAIQGQDLVKTFTFPTDTQRPDIKVEMEYLLSVVQQWSGWSTDAVSQHNAELEQLARETIQTRRERVLGDHAHLDDLGIPVRRRSDAPETYAAPGIARRKPVAPKAAGDAPTAPEPTMVGALYEHIVSLIRAWGRAVERTPAPHRDANEETLRDALLPMLNTHYEGGATGETFNAEGKTDILIRVEDRTVFIGECKWWSGPAAVGEALDQLFSYTTWRDTKLSLMFFVDRKDPMAVIAKAKEALEGHDLFIEWGDSGDERELRCTMRWPGDETITAQLHVFFVHLPNEGT
jgi:hypothetical protein